MSFEINWEKLSDDDGSELSETIRAFLDQRFKEMTLPSYLKSISVTSFDLGSIAPDIEIRRITDPFPEFYLDDDYDDVPGTTGGDSRGGGSASGGGGGGPPDLRTTARRDDIDNRSVAESRTSEPPAYETDESESGYPLNNNSIRFNEVSGSLSFNSMMIHDPEKKKLIIKDAFFGFFW